MEHSISQFHINSMKKISYLTLFIIIFMRLNLIAQNNETIQVQVQASLVLGISVISTNNEINFDEIILSGSQMSITKSPVDGLRFKIISHPEKPVMISFENSQLQPEFSANINSPSNLLFIPKIVHTGNKTEFVNPVEVTSDVYYQPANQAGEGILNLWVGGSLLIEPQVSHGNYSGTIIITVAY